MMLDSISAWFENARMFPGFRCAERHLNESDGYHGGMIASFCDHHGFAAQAEAGFDFVMATIIKLGFESVKPVRVCDWVVGQAQLLKLTRRLLFSTFTGRIDGRTAVHPRAIFRWPNKPDTHGAPLMRQIRAAMPQETQD
jgi:acyl-coenzyme A thioesterase PaaI-like protein